MGRIAKPAENLPNATRRLFDLIVSLGITRQEFAQKVGMSTSGVNSLIHRPTEVSPMLAKAVELEFGISQQWLLEGIGSKEAQRGGELTFYQQLCLRLVPRHDPAMIWDCFESLQSYPFKTINTVNVDSAKDYERAALLIWEVDDDEQWWEKFQDLQSRFIELRSQLRNSFLDLAEISTIGGYDQTLLFRNLLDGVMPSEEDLQAEKFIHATEQYLSNLRQFGWLRQQYGRFWKLPMELKKIYVRCHNQNKNNEEAEALDAHRQGRLLVNVEGWLRLDNQQQIVEDFRRKELFELRLKMANLEGQKSNRKLLEKINQKLELLHQQEKKLLAEWSGDGTRSK
jgi:transcriptional regulator with XRE-family HTH domain